jgi:prolyl 4-hydroxylase
MATSTKQKNGKLPSSPPAAAAAQEKQKVQKNVKTDVIPDPTETDGTGVTIKVLGLSVFIMLISIILANKDYLQARLSSKCEDYNVRCAEWAQASECSSNPDYMSVYCAKSCAVCTVAANQVANNQSNAPKNSPNAEQQTIQASTLAVREDEEEEDEDDEEEAQGGNEKEEDGGICGDTQDECVEWARSGRCAKNSYWMESNCKRSCGLCPKCSDADKSCGFWASAGECEKNPNWMLVNCPQACNVCGKFVEDLSKPASCQDKLDSMDCAVRKSHGDCENSPGWMTVFCGRTCGRCDLLSQGARCIPEVFNDTEYRYENALKKGDVTRVFTSVLQKYPQAEVILQPPKGPWVIKLPNFVTELERSRILAHTLPKVKRSTDQGEFNEEGVQEQVVSSGRTSSNAWCQDACVSDPVVANLTERISKLVTVPVKNFESFQVLQYKIGQKYDSHHDSSDETRHDLSGPRIFTFFIYLSDVEEGGETFFDKLGVKVKPQRNMVVMWPSVLDDEPNKVDWRTTHAALPVIKGEKLAANIWMHLRDFTTPNLWGCTGAFEE